MFKNEKCTILLIINTPQHRMIDIVVSVLWCESVTVVWITKGLLRWSADALRAAARWSTRAVHQAQFSPLWPSLVARGRVRWVVLFLFVAELFRRSCSGAQQKPCERLVCTSPVGSISVRWSTAAHMECVKRLTAGVFQLNLLEKYRCALCGGRVIKWKNLDRHSVFPSSLFFITCITYCKLGVDGPGLQVSARVNSFHPFYHNVMINEPPCSDSTDSFL